MLSIVDLDFGLLFWMLLAFLIVFGILAKFGFPAITGMIEERKKFIDDSLKNAREANEKLSHIQEEGEQLMAQARARQDEILKEAKATRDRIVAAAKEKAEAESARMLEDARREIRHEKEVALADIRSQVAGLAVEVAGKVLRQNLQDRQKQMELIDRLLDDVVVEP